MFFRLIPSRASFKRLAESELGVLSLFVDVMSLVLEAKRRLPHAAPAVATGSAILVTWLPARMIF